MAAAHTLRASWRPFKICGTGDVTISQRERRGGEGRDQSAGDGIYRLGRSAIGGQRRPSATLRSLLALHPAVHLVHQWSNS